jgi:APA family basic amino acid/polyamine antiporter
MASRARPDPAPLRRELGTFGAAAMGLGSIVGTGVFVSIGVAAGVTGPSVVLAIAIGALVATFNGLSSAQLAANHPVSGGTYAYGYRYLTPALGFLAGWTFLLAKGASAATAALGFAGYALATLGVAAPGATVPVALLVVAALTGVVLAGLRQSHWTNVAIVSVTLASLGFFVLAGLPTLVADGAARFAPFLDPEPGRGGVAALLSASALMFVAFTGYGRIATLGEEVRDPRRTIPRAIVLALVAVGALYAAVAVVAVGGAGAAALADPAHRSAPLAVAAAAFDVPLLDTALAVGAIAAMAGVLLNLILGLSRVLLAMGRERDVPALFARLDPSGRTPTAAVVAVGVGIAALALLGDVRTTWSFSAFAVLVYYAITNAAALRLSDAERFYPRWVSWAGLASCATLAWFVDPAVWATGLGLLAVGLGWHALARRRRERRA